MVSCLSLRNVRVSRVSGAIKGAHPIPIEGIARQSCVSVARGVCPYRSDLRKVYAVISGAALDEKTVLVSGIVRPRQVYLTRRSYRRRQVTRGVWHRSRCRSRRGSWGRCGSHSRRRSRRHCRRWGWSRRGSGGATTTRELERADARTPGETGRRRVILRGVPEGAVVHRINSHIAIITPTAVRARLAAGAGEHRNFSLRQGT